MIELPIEGLTIESVRIDFTVALEGKGGSIMLESPVLVEQSESTTLIGLGEVDRTGDPTFDHLVGVRVVAASATEGVLRVSFEDGTRLTARPSPDYESWTVAARGGAMYICTPGGRVTVF